MLNSILNCTIRKKQKTKTKQNKTKKRSRRTQSCTRFGYPATHCDSKSLQKFGPPAARQVQSDCERVNNSRAVRCHRSFLYSALSTECERSPTPRIDSSSRLIEVSEWLSSSVRRRSLDQTIGQSKTTNGIEILNLKTACFSSCESVPMGLPLGRLSI